MDESEAHLLEIGKLILIIHEEFLKDQDGKLFNVHLIICTPYIY